MSENLDLILAILLGRKVKDDAGLWHVFAADGTEISDPGSVLLRGNLGALLTWPNPVIEEIVQQAGGGGPDAPARHSRYRDIDTETPGYLVRPANWDPRRPDEGWAAPHTETPPVQTHPDPAPVQTVVATQQALRQAAQAVDAVVASAQAALALRKEQEALALATTLLLLLDEDEY